MEAWQLVIGTIVAIGWIAVGGTPALVISMIAGTLMVVMYSIDWS